MQIKHIESENIYEVTGSCYYMDENENLFLAVSYIDWEETKTIDFLINENWDATNESYQLINE